MSSLQRFIFFFHSSVSVSKCWEFFKNERELGTVLTALTIVMRTNMETDNWVAS